MIPPQARRHQYVEKEEELPKDLPTITMDDLEKREPSEVLPQPGGFETFEEWRKLNPEGDALGFLPSLQKREVNTERLKKLSKWQAIGDALSQVAQVTGASLGAGEMSADGVRPYQGNAFLEKYRQRLVEDEEREERAKQMELQNHIRNIGLYRADKQADTNRRHQTGLEIQRARTQRENAQFQHELGEPEREFNQRLAQERLAIDDRDSRSRASLSRENVEQQRVRTDLVRQKLGQELDEKQREQQSWHVIQTPSGSDVAPLREIEAVNLFGFLLEKMRETGQITDDAYESLYSLENTHPTSIKRFINSHWEKFDETKEFVERIRNRNTPNNADPLGLGITEEEDPLGLFR